MTLEGVVDIKKDITENHFLLPFEKRRLRGQFRDYIKIKRNNFFATIQSFPQLWNCFELLDEIWMRGFSDLEHPGDVKQLLPIMIFMNAHARFRTAFELAFSCCLSDAFNVLRSGIESVAHAHKILREPHLARTWLDKDKGSAEKQAYRNAFEKKKLELLFPPQHGLKILYDFWSTYSETATHTTVASLGLRFQSNVTADQIHWQLNYFETDEPNLACFLFSLLVASFHMEDALFRSFESRLKLDVRLGKMRKEFGQFVRRTRLDILKRYGKDLSQRLQEPANDIP